MPSILNPRLRWFSMVLALVAIFALAAACGDDDDDDDDNGTDPTATSADSGGNDGNGEIDYSELSGNVDIDGSSTVFPIAVIAAEEFGLASNVRVNVGLSGSGGGFEKFCRGETQISNSSRPIKDDEIEACANNGIDDIVELQVAIDALSIVVNPENDWATCLTVDELVSIFSAGGAENWNEVRPEFPDESIIKYYPGADSGTFDYFTEVLEDAQEGAVHTSDGTSSEDDNVLVIGVEGGLGAIGYFGLSYYVEAGQSLNAVAIENDAGDCVAPAADAAQSGEYNPYSRPLFNYTSESYLSERPELVGYFAFLFENLEEFVNETGYATMSAEKKAEEYAKIEPFLP